MLASIIKFKKPRFKISRLILIVDLAVILSGVFIFGLQKSVWALIALVVSTKTIDLTLTGVKNERVVFIISRRHEEIALDIRDTLKRGSTLIEGVGTYTGEVRKILFTVVTSREIPPLKDLVSHHDPSAFMTVSDAREVLGEGFESIIKNKNSLV